MHHVIMISIAIWIIVWIRTVYIRILTIVRVFINFAIGLWYLLLRFFFLILLIPLSPSSFLNFAITIIFLVLYEFLWWNLNLNTLSIFNHLMLNTQLLMLLLLWEMLRMIWGKTDIIVEIVVIVVLSKYLGTKLLWRFITSTTSCKVLFNIRLLKRIMILVAWFSWCTIRISDFLSLIGQMVIP